MKDLRRHLAPGTAGTLSWTSPSGNAASIVFFAGWDGAKRMVTVEYRWHAWEDIRIPIVLETTPTQFGGKRWWFICPLAVRGVACNRRAGKLYLPPEAKYFGCRRCHQLSYRSCQETHKRNDYAAAEAPDTNALEIESVAGGSF
jgi:hypothetical protein